VVKTHDGAVMAKELKRRTAKSIELRSFNPTQAERTLAVDDVLWMARHRLGEPVTVDRHIAARTSPPRK